jgi:predicted amidophosphoribosyltransferase
VAAQPVERIHEGEPAHCDGCGETTNTIRGRCPECGYVKDDTWLPRPRRNRIFGDGPEDWVVVVLAAGVLGVVVRTLVAILN